MIDKRVWSGAIAIVTLIVAGASALPELLLRPGSSRPTVVLPVIAPKAEPVAKPEQAMAEVRSAVPTDVRTDSIAPPKETIAAAPQPVAPVPEEPKREPAASTPAAVPIVAFPPVQPVGVAAASASDPVPLASRPAGANTVRFNVEKPPRPERTARRAEKPKKAVRPAAYPIREFLAWRR